MQEIERKFLVSGFPEYPLLEEATVWQGYLCVQPVVRIRKKEAADHTDYVLCFKGKGTLCRKEIELDISREIFDELEELLEAPMIRKDYKVYALDGGYRLECSRVDRGTSTEFYFAEVEFASLEEAKAFNPLTFLSNEVTEDPYYSMGRYWQRKCEALHKASRN